MRRAAGIAGRALGLDALLATAFALVIAWPFLDPSRLVAGFDTIAYTVPNQAVAFEAFTRGDLPSWNPFVFAGTPHLANPQVGGFYLPKLPFAWLDSPHRAVLLITALHLVWLALGMVVLLGGALKLRRPAPLLGAVTMTGSGVVLAQSLHFEQILTIAWAPWVLAAVESIVAGRLRPRRGAALLGIAVSQLLLAGHQQPAYYVLVLAGVWSGARLIEVRRPRLALPLVSGVTLGVALAAVQLLPTLHLLGRSVRQAGLTLASLEVPGQILVPRRVGAALLGDPFAASAVAATGGIEASAYVGVVAMTLAAAGVAAGVRGQQRRLFTVVVALAAVVACVLAAGPRTIAYRAAFKLVPGFDLVRAPARWVLVTDLALAVLAALAVDAAARRRLDRRTTAAAATVLAVFFLVLALGPFDGPSGAAGRWWILGSVAALAITAAAGSTKGQLGGIALTALVVVASVELGVAAAHSAPSDTSVPAARAELGEGDAAAFLQARPERALAIGAELLGNPDYLGDTLRPNINATARVRTLDGYDGGPALTETWTDAMAALTTERFNPDLTLRAQLQAPIDPELLARFGVRWILVDAGVFPPEVLIPDWDGPVIREGTLHVWENPAYEGEAFVYTSAQRTEREPGPQIKALGERLRTTALLSGEAADSLGCAGNPPRSRAELSRPRPDRIVVSTAGDQQCPSVLVVAEQWDDGWEATVDGERAAVVRADGAFLGIPLAPGSHRVQLSYRVPELRLGALITTLAAFAILALLVWPPRRSPRERVAAGPADAPE